MSRKHIISLLNLQAQDKIVRFELSPYTNELGAEIVYYVSSVNYEQEIVHALSFSGNAYEIKFDDVSDIIKADEPVLVLMPAETWVQHRCDPAYLGKPVRAVAMTIYEGRITGVAVPKWPCSEKGVITWSARAGDTTLPGLTDADLMRALPAFGFNPKRYSDGAASRNRDYRIASTKIKNMITGVILGDLVTPKPDAIKKRRPA